VGVWILGGTEKEKKRTRRGRMINEVHWTKEKTSLDRKGTRKEDSTIRKKQKNRKRPTTHKKSMADRPQRLRESKDEKTRSKKLIRCVKHQARS